MEKITFTRLLPRFDESSDMATANSSINSASNVGQNAINSYDPTAAGNNAINTTNNNFGTSQNEAGTIGSQLSSAVKANPTVTDLYTTANNMFNVPSLQTQATDLTNRLNNVQPNAYQAAKGFDIDSTDINNGIANATAYLQPEANAATANANTASGLASNFVQAGQAQNAQNLIPAETEATTEQQNIAAQETGWNQATASQLQGLIDKMNAGVTLSGSELQAANQLAQTEENYNAAIQSAQIGANAQIQSAQYANQYQKLSPAEQLINTFKNNNNVYTNTQ